MRTTATGVQSPSRIARRTSTKGVRTRQGPETTLTAEEGQQRYNASARVIQERDDLTDTQKAKMIRKLKTKYGIR